MRTHCPKKEVMLTQREKDIALAKYKLVLDGVSSKSRISLEKKILDEALQVKIERVKRNRGNRGRGKALEKKLADELQLERVPYSGSNAEFGWGDIKSEFFLGEAKSITPKGKQKNITILIKDFDDVVKHAQEQNKIPFYATRLKNHTQIYVVMRIEDWKKCMVQVGMVKDEQA